MRMTRTGGLFSIKEVTHGPTHHFYGFHDLVQWNAKGDLMLGLEVSDISHPPYLEDRIASGVIDPGAKKFYKIHETSAFNYPQGAWQQWVGDADLYTCNDRHGNMIVAHLVDARERKIVETLPFSIHTLNARTGETFSIDYARLYRVGGYGYIGIEDIAALEDIPAKSGIFKGNINSRQSELLVSIQDVAKVGTEKLVRTGYPHYLTHPVLSPDGERLAFLHRYRVRDGGEITRLMTVGVDGSSLRCLAKGFLSHFDWIDDKTIFIWGKHYDGIVTIRDSKLMENPLCLFSIGIAKKIIRMVRKYGTVTQIHQTKSFLMVKDHDETNFHSHAVGVLTSDGHPMVCPRHREWMVIDTYPDLEGFRSLMLYNWKKNIRCDLGRFLHCTRNPVVSAERQAEIFRNVDPRVKAKFPTKTYNFTRSGYHCDLHPRWNYNGTKIAFDSIHEGTRQIYTVDVAGLIEEQGDING
jgi:hypothetical protein